MSEKKSKLQKVADVEVEAEMRRAIEAILMVAIDPVSPGMKKQSWVFCLSVSAVDTDFKATLKKPNGWSVLF